MRRRLITSCRRCFLARCHAATPVGMPANAEQKRTAYGAAFFCVTMLSYAPRCYCAFFMRATPLIARDIHAGVRYR